MEESEIIEQKVHPNYVGIFAVLAILTAVEVGITYLPVPRVPILVPLAILKATLVALFYMHLKFDRKIFSIMFGLGLLMALGLIISFLIIFYSHPVISGAVL